MKLSVRVTEARNLPAMDHNGFSDPYVRLQLGRTKFKTKVVKKSLNPFWGEEFSFRVDDLNEELNISVLDEDKYFNDDFVGQLKVPVSSVFDAKDKTLGTTWYSLQPKNRKSKNKDCGEILLTVCFSQNNATVDLKSDSDHGSYSKKNADVETELARPIDSPLRSSSPLRIDEIASTKEDKSCTQRTFAGLLAQVFNKNGDMTSIDSMKDIDLPEPPENTETELSGGVSEEQSFSESFEDLMRRLESMDQGIETPDNLPGGILIDQSYVIAPQDLNSFLFSPVSNFSKTLADIQGTTELQEGPWKFENSGTSLKRVVSYVKAPTKIIKAVKGIEVQTYLKGDGKVFAVLSIVNTPDVMYGSTFRVELLFRIMPGPELPSGEQSSQLTISWRMNFLQNTMMKGMIEGGARQGTKDSFEQYAKLLSELVKPVDMKDVKSSKEQLLASLEVETQSDWRLAVQYFANFTVVSTLLIGVYVSVHIWLASPSAIQGLEFGGLDLPDSVGEVIVCGILVLQGKRVFELIGRFMHARAQKGSDHGVKALGDGWLLTVALIEGCNLAAIDSSGFSDPYVVLTCNGKTKTSSIKFQQSDPTWNEIYEFDAMDEPPSVLDVEVYDFDGPFDEATSLGHVEINFVKSNISDLEDIWVPLHGKLAKACQSKLHLRIYLDNTRGGSVVKDYLTKMEKEVGKKINVRSPHTNSVFQKIFGLPPEEFLINDFTCYLKRKMPLQGRLFLSPRIVGFHANLFGHKTKFFFLWEDIEDIQVVAPTLSSMGSPSIIMTLRQGRGMDARHGAKMQDGHGRLKFHFQSFVSFNVAHRTLMALWKARSLSPEQKVQIVEEDSEDKSLQNEENGSCWGLEDVSMSEVYATFLPITFPATKQDPFKGSCKGFYFILYQILRVIIQSCRQIQINSIMELFNGSELERKVMTKIGCDNYSCSQWEADKADVYQRQVYYKLSEGVSHYRGEVTSTQQRSRLLDKNGWLVEEVMSLHGVPLSDSFNLHLRYQVEDTFSKSRGCHVQVYFGIAWLKSTKHQKRVTKNIISNLQHRLKLMFDAVERFATTK